MKFKPIYSVIVLFVFLAVSCGPKKKTQIVMKPETTTIAGDLSDCFEVVDQECVVKLKNGGLEPFATWGVKIRRTDNPLPFPEGVKPEPYGTFGSGVQALAGFGLEVVDENGTIIQKNAATQGGLGGAYSSDDVKGILKLKPGEDATIRWTVDKAALEGKELKFKISSAYELVEESTTSIDNDDYSQAYKEAKDEFDNAYKEAKDEYKKAYEEAKKEYKNAYKQAQKELDDALDDLDW